MAIESHVLLTSHREELEFPQYDLRERIGSQGIVRQTYEKRIRIDGSPRRRFGCRARVLPLRLARKHTPREADFGVNESTAGTTRGPAASPGEPNANDPPSMSDHFGTSINWLCHIDPYPNRSE